MSLLKRIYWNIDDFHRSHIAINKINPRTGISEKTRKRLKNHNSTNRNSTNIFGKKIIYNHGPSILHSIDELFIGEVYKYQTNKNNPLIIDCGANIGLSLLYFIKQNPNAKIIAFEPDKEIFKILEENVKNFDTNNNITLFNKAVWNENTTLSFFVQGGLSGSLVTDFAKGNNKIEIEAINLNDYLQQEVDFLKIDIEGAENEIFKDISKNLHNVQNLFLEYHAIKNEPQKLSEILKIIEGAGFRYYITEAAQLMRFPFLKQIQKNSFDVQLNIFCYRI